MIKRIQHYEYIIGAIVVITLACLFFWKVFVYGLFPVPSDSLVGLYHPYRDLYADTNPNGVVYKNFLITDPIRQQYPWRLNAISQIYNGELPIWNTNTFSGGPLIANLQSAVFYPLNILYALGEFNWIWTMQIILQPVLAGLFMFMYLYRLRMHVLASLLGALTYAFSGFSLAWLTWNTVLHVSLWLPLILLAIDSLLNSTTLKKNIVWTGILIIAFSSSLFAGHAQTYFYLICISMVYLIAKVYLKYKNNEAIVTKLIFSSVAILASVVITAIQWIPTYKFIEHSARHIDHSTMTEEGWFLPWQHFVQFIAPDFFGNPSTLNYWGTWNYAELVGYVGIVSMVLAIVALIYRKDKKTLFFGSLLFIALLLVTPNTIAKIPFQLSFPFVSTAQPTRLLFVVDFVLSVLAALGFDMVLRGKLSIRKIVIVLAIVFSIIAIIWSFIIAGKRGGDFIPELLQTNLSVAKRNMYLPTLLTVGASFVLVLLAYVASSRKYKKLIPYIASIVLLILVVDLFRFGWKFTPFTSQEYLFPTTNTLEFIQNIPGVYRIMSTDRKIVPPNTTTPYGIQTVEGYDPLYLSEYGELIAAWIRNKPDISPMHFNRILTPQNYDSPIARILNAKYVVSLDEQQPDILDEVHREGSTIVYENNQVLDRAYLVESVIKANTKQEAIEYLFDQSTDLSKTAVVYDDIDIDNNLLEPTETSEIVSYKPNYVSVQTTTKKTRLLVLSDVYYPTWTVTIDGEKAKLYKVNYILRGVVVPEGDHVIEFRTSLL